jgi:hypothetical protein
MITPQQFRERAVEFGELVKQTHHPDAIRELQRQQRAFADLADNEDWMSRNLDKTVPPTSPDVSDLPTPAEDDPIVSEDKGYILACLGAAVIMQWNTFPTRLQKELFDNASSMGELLQSDVLKGQIARFLHNHKDDAAPKA